MQFPRRLPATAAGSFALHYRCCSTGRMPRTRCRTVSQRVRTPEFVSRAIPILHLADSHRRKCRFNGSSSKARSSGTSLDESQHGSLDDWPAWVVDFRPNPAQACAAMEAKQAIEKHVDQLSAGVHSAFRLRVLEGLSAKETREVLRVSTSRRFPHDCYGHGSDWRRC